MTKKTKAAKDTAAPTQGKEIPGNGAPLLNNAHYIKDLSFENPGIVKNLLQQSSAPEIAINIQVEVKKIGDRLFEVVLVIEAKATQDKTPMFILELTYGGLFMIESSVPEADWKPLLLVDAPTLLFPFARRVVADNIKDGGLPPLLLNPVDFRALYQQQENVTLN
jgi:preprotein translocase subunit SecB